MSRAGTNRSSISSAKPVGRTAPCGSGCSVGSCRRCRSAAPLSPGSSMTRPCSRAAGMGSPSSIRAWSARRPTASQPVAGDRGRQHASDLYLPEEWAQTPSAGRGATPPHVPHQDRDGDRSDPPCRCLPRGIVLADAAYGGARSFRDALRDLALSYALGIESNTVPAATADPATGRTRSVKVQAGRVDVLARAWEPHHRLVARRIGRTVDRAVRGAPGSGRSDAAP